MRPTPEQLRASVRQTMPDIIAPDLRVLFCGINPSVYSVVVGHHFARPGNRFWPALWKSGFTPTRFEPTQDTELLALGLGITNVASMATVAAADLTLDELLWGGQELRARVERFAPRWLAVLGIGAFRVAFGQPRAMWGEQSARIGQTRIWILPNPSGLNAHYTPAHLAQVFREFRVVVDADERSERAEFAKT